MNSCVCASMPGVTRTITGWILPSERATKSSVSNSWGESMTTWPTWLSTQKARNPADLLLPWTVMRSAGNPAASAMRSSLIEATSSESPSSSTHRATFLDRKALEA